MKSSPRRRGDAETSDSQCGPSDWTERADERSIGSNLERPLGASAEKSPIKTAQLPSEARSRPSGGAKIAQPTDGPCHALIRGEVHARRAGDFSSRALGIVS